MAFWDKKIDDPAQEVKDRVAKLERENESAVKMDHRFGVMGVLVVAVAALIGMSYDAVQGVLQGHIGQADAVQLATAFGAIFVMNRALLAAARNIRRAESRGEQPRPRDLITMYGVMAIESVSFAYMLWLFEGRPNMLSVPGFLLAGRAGVLPYATVYLEQQRQQPPDPVDIGIQAEIGQGLGVMAALVEQAYDKTLPTQLKLSQYRANATLTPKMDQRLERMTHAAQAYDHFKATGEILPAQQQGKAAPEPPPSDSEADVDALDLLSSDDPASASQTGRIPNGDQADPAGAFGETHFTSASPELKQYVLPDGVTLTLHGSLSDISALLGVRYQDVSKAMKRWEMTYMPAIDGQADNAKNISVAQVLALVEAAELPMPTRVSKRSLSVVQ